MNFRSIVNDICCDSRIKDGVLRLENPDHVFIVQEYLEKAGYSLNEIVDKTANLFEAGRFPDRQAYNKDGILVTFPSKEYRDRAVNKGTHFAENPKKAQSNIFTTPGDLSSVGATEEKPEEKPDSVSIDKEVQKDVEADDGVDSRTPKEKQQDAVANVAILKGQTPLVNYSVDEAIKYGFYRKGMLWFNTEGQLIGEQVFDEARGGSTIRGIGVDSQIEAKSSAIRGIDVDLKTLSTFEVLMEMTKRNAPVLETFPLLKCLGINDRESLKNFVNSGDINKYDFTSEGKYWIKQIVPLLDNNYINNLFFDFYNKAAGSNKSLNNISKEKVDSFIHASIIDYRKLLKAKTNIEEESKENTSDVILIYGGTKNDLLSSLGRITSEQDLLVGKDGLISFKNNPSLKFAQVSLKKGDAKLGKITKKFFSMIGASSMDEGKLQSLNEGMVTDFITGLKNKVTTAGEFLSKKMSDVYNWFISKIKTFYESVTNIFREIPMNDIEQQDKKLEELTLNLEEANKNSITSINEMSGDDIPITDCNYIAMTQFYLYYKKIGFKDLIQQYTALSTMKKEGGFNVKVESIDQQKYLKIDTTIQQTFDIFNKAAATKNYFKEETTLVEARSCTPTGKSITREQIEPVLKLRANHIALRKIDELLKSIKNNASTTNIDVKDLPSIAANLSAEAVFGNNTNLPLFKFTGDDLIYLGTKQNYVTKKRDQFTSLDLSDMNLGYIHVYQTQKQSAVHFQIYMYLLFDLEGDEKVLTPMYSEIAFTVGSGSKFAFNVEMNNVVSLNEVKTKMR